MLFRSAQVARTFASGKPGGAGGGDFVAGAVSPRGGLIYGLTEDGTLCAFDGASGRLLHSLAAHGDKGAIGLAHHPHRNLLASWAEEGLCRLWKPEA